MKMKHFWTFSWSILTLSLVSNSVLHQHFWQRCNKKMETWQKKKLSTPPSTSLMHHTFLLLRDLWRIVCSRQLEPVTASPIRRINLDDSREHTHLENRRTSMMVARVGQDNKWKSMSLILRSWETTYPDIPVSDFMNSVDSGFLASGRIRHQGPVKPSRKKNTTVYAS